MREKSTKTFKHGDKVYWVSTRTRRKQYRVVDYFDETNNIVRFTCRSWMYADDIHHTEKKK